MLLAHTRRTKIVVRKHQLKKKKRYPSSWKLTLVVILRREPSRGEDKIRDEDQQLQQWKNKTNNRNILSQKCESRSFTSITTTTPPRQAARVTHQSQRQTGEQRDQAEDDIRAPNRNAKLVRHVVVATLENTRGAIKGGKIERQTECVKRLILW